VTSAQRRRLGPSHGIVMGVLSHCGVALRLRVKAPLLRLRGEAILFRARGTGVQLHVAASCEDSDSAMRLRCFTIV
jgi:hypothetical protein